MRLSIRRLDRRGFAYEWVGGSLRPETASKDDRTSPNASAPDSQHGTKRAPWWHRLTHR